MGLNLKMVKNKCIARAAQFEKKIHRDWKYICALYKKNK